MLKIIDNFTDYLKYNLKSSENTIKNYPIDINQFAEFIAEQNGLKKQRETMFKNVKFTDVDNYIAMMSKKGLAVSTIQRKVFSVRKFYNYLTRIGYIGYNPVIDVELPEKEEKIPLSMTQEEVDLFLNTVGNANMENMIRDKAMFKIYLDCGLRLTELINIDLSDINEDMITIRKTKNKKQKIAFLNKSTLEELNKYLEVRNQQAEKYKLKDEDKDALFISCNGRMSNRNVQKTFEKYRDMAGLNKEYTVHTLRHTCGMRLHEKGEDLRTIQQILGHKNIATTTIYVTSRDEALRKAINRLDEK